MTYIFQCTILVITQQISCTTLGVHKHVLVNVCVRSFCVPENSGISECSAGFNSVLLSFNYFAGVAEGDDSQEKTGEDDAVHRHHIHSPARSLLHHILHDILRSGHPSQRDILRDHPRDFAISKRRDQSVYIFRTF